MDKNCKRYKWVKTFGRCLFSPVEEAEEEEERNGHIKSNKIHQANFKKETVDESKFFAVQYQGSDKNKVFLLKQFCLIKAL